MNKELAIKAYQMGFAVIDNTKMEEIMGIDEIEDDGKYYFVVGENQEKSVKKVISEYIIGTSYKPKEVDIDEVIRQITVHYIACIEGDLVESLVLLPDSIKASVELFIVDQMCDISEYDAEI